MNNLDFRKSDLYVTEAKLGVVLDAIYGRENIIRQFGFEGSRLKFDFLINGTTLVEFDGHVHYTEATQQERDHRKEILAANAGMKIIRVPYWVQLSTEMIAYYFGVNHEVKQVFPHGFITKTCTLPANFNHIGIDRFRNEIDDMIINSPDMASDVKQSLVEWRSERGEKYVVPPFLRYYATI